MADPLMDDDARPRRRIKQMEVMVAEAISETPDTTTLVLFTGNDTLDYEPGHFLTIDPHTIPSLERFVAYLEDVKGKKEPPRAYSLASSPHERHLAVTVKEERYISGVTKYPPILSPLLVHRTLPGTRMVVTGFTGPYTLPPDIEQQTDHLLHVCAGSGFVPNWSIIKHALVTEMRLRHTVICCNKTWDDVIFRPQLQQLADLAHSEGDAMLLLPQDKRTALAPVGTTITAFAFNNRRTAARAAAVGCVVDLPGFTVCHDLAGEVNDLLHDRLRLASAMFDLFELSFPFAGHFG